MSIRLVGAPRVSCVVCGAPGVLRSLVVDDRVVAVAEACDTHWADYVRLANERVHLVNAMTAAGCARVDADRLVDAFFEKGRCS